MVKCVDYGVSQQGNLDDGIDNIIKAKYIMNGALGICSGQ